MRLVSVRCSAAVVLTALSGSSRAEYDEACGVHFESGQRLTNWSSTHEASPRRVYEPRSAQEVVRVLQLHHHTHTKVRPVGTALSPNGIGLSSSSSDNLLSLTFLDHVEVDVERKLVTVGAGARVSTVLSALAKHGLTLENFSSIQEQQLGGWTQVSAHGTGITLPPVDEMIVRLQLATPTEGLMTMRAGLGGHDDFVFRHAKVGLGSLGVVTELTLKCIPQLNLHETTTVSTREDISQGHAQRLRAHRHVRYMWLPYTDVVVAVVSSPTQERARPFVVSASDALQQQQQPATEALCALLHSLQPNNTTLASLQSLSFAQLRDRLLDLAPLDDKHIRAVNAAEAIFWRRSCGTRVDDSTQILGFDCGGEQLVLEVCFPMAGKTPQSDNEKEKEKEKEKRGDDSKDPGSLASGRDLAFVKELLQIAERHGLPTPCPIEQRWTARSTAPMSPAYSPDPAAVFCWVGIIMYLPPEQTSQGRELIRRRFQDYRRSIEPLCEASGAKAHWAKIEPPDDEQELLRTQRRLREDFPVHEFNELRDALDPRRILSNKMVDLLLGKKGKN